MLDANTIWSIPTVRKLAAGIVAAGLLGGGVAHGQNSSLFGQDAPKPTEPVLNVANSSWIFQRVQPPQQVRLHDIVTIVVNQKAKVNSEGQVNRRKTAVYNAQLKNWIEFDHGSIKLAPQRQGQPQANGTLDQEMQADTQLQTNDLMTFTIAAEVVDIRPNGNLVVEAHQHIQLDEDIWDKSLTGVVRRQDVTPLNTILSENIAELSIDKHEVGHVRDGYRRGWLTRLYDRFSIF